MVASRRIQRPAEIFFRVRMPPLTGLACESLSENKTCDSGVCPVDCELSDWSRGLARDSTRPLSIETERDRARESERESYP